MQQDAMLKVRADLCERIDRLKAAIAHGPIAGLCDRVTDLRRFAQQYDVHPVADLAWRLESRLAHGERGAGVQDMLTLMREATQSGRVDAQAAGLWAAAASVRLM